MPINRDFEREQDTGVCSYCGNDLGIIDLPDGDMMFDTCFYCDDYDQEEAAEFLEFGE